MQAEIHGPERRDGEQRIDWDAEYRRHARWLRTVVASRLQEPAAVEDVMQQIALAVAREDRRPVDANRIGGWLYRVAIKQCLQYRRTAGRRRRLLHTFTRTIAGDDALVDPLDWLLYEERVESVRTALGRLSDLDRQLLLLKYTEEWSCRQLAEHLGVNVKAVEYRLQLARERLRRAVVQQQVVDVPS
jgi:RNA polymerase sigma-70 factor (ECF subfamily)